MSVNNQFIDDEIRLNLALASEYKNYEPTSVSLVDNNKLMFLLETGAICITLTVAQLESLSRQFSVVEYDVISDLVLEEQKAFFGHNNKLIIVNLTQDQFNYLAYSKQLSNYLSMSILFDSTHKPYLQITNNYEHTFNLELTEEQLEALQVKTSFSDVSNLSIVDNQIKFDHSSKNYEINLTTAQLEEIYHIDSEIISNIVISHHEDGSPYLQIVLSNGITHNLDISENMIHHIFMQSQTERNYLKQ